jgi:(4-(4-[2-(gamma-L-glutamylamino)ethyl]phenoxymethyl)furan-2-yl)methanamine synthase
VARNVLGLDVGGANLKAAHPSGAARSAPFALWKDPGGLADALRALITTMPPAELWAVTMTGELCDCFAGKREGVAAILDAVEAAAGPTSVCVYTNENWFVDAAEARARPLEVASANWLALAVVAGGQAPEGPAVLLDVGSTTTDVIPLFDGMPIPGGLTDPERLASGELVYTGFRRTPVCALLDRTGAGAGLAAEVFATTLDAYLILEMIPEDPDDRNTADGRPATRAAAHARMARMLCADLETSTEDQRRRLAEAVRKAQESKIQWALERASRALDRPPRTAVVAGEGAPLAWRVLERMEWFRGCKGIDLGRVLGKEIARAACAYAVAVLAAERGKEPPDERVTRRR